FPLFSMCLKIHLIVFLHKTTSMKFITLLFLIMPFLTMAQQKSEWNLNVQNDLGEWIPLRMYFDSLDFKATKIESALNIVNATEVIRLEPFKISNDTTYYRFIDYNAEIALTKINDLN